MTDPRDALRGAYFDALSGRLGPVERPDLLAALAAAPDAPLCEAEGLALSAWPSARLSALRYVAEELIPEDLRPLFRRPSGALPGLLAAFADPQELHFRTFENILPLDRLLRASALPLSLADARPLGRLANAWTFPLVAPAGTLALLGQIDALDLYAPPLNPGSRGGRRLVFHSARLGEALTAAVRASLPPEALPGFSHVNPVFRCNRFEPGDAPFRGHYDAPYYDAARGHISRYTLLIYLTGGEGGPALRVEGEALDAIAPRTCVLFDQRYAHEGAPFAAGSKVFLRTELIYSEPDLAHDPGIARDFSRACYLTGESAFDPSLSAAAHDCYDRVARAHWEGLKARGEPIQPEPFLRKRFRGVPFVANGYDFWFRKGDLPLRECAALAVLDYFNCKIGGAAFRKLCLAEVQYAADSSWIPGFFEGLPAAPPAPPLGRLDKDALLPPPEAPDGVCCDAHTDSFVAQRNRIVILLYEHARGLARERILPAPVLVLGQEIFLDPDQFVIQGNQIHVLSRERLAPVNFASCWDDSTPHAYLGAEAAIEALGLLIPPVLFSEVDGCYHLMLDLFRNSWMARCEPQIAQIPRIHEEHQVRDPRAYGPPDDRYPRPVLDEAPPPPPAPRPGPQPKDDDDLPF